MVLNITSQRDGEWTVVTVAGVLDVNTAPELHAAFNQLIASGSHHVIVDLEGVELTDATGLGVLCAAESRLTDAGGSLQVVCTQDEVLKVFELTGLAHELPVHQSITQALAAPIGAPRATPGTRAASSRK